MSPASSTLPVATCKLNGETLLFSFTLQVIKTMRNTRLGMGILVNSLSIAIIAAADTSALDFQRVRYNNPGLVVDLGVGLWAQPLPMDYDGDGDYDLVVVCSDKPYNGTYFFENPERHHPPSGTASSSLPVFKPAVRIDDGPKNVQISYVDGTPRVIVRGLSHDNFPTDHFSKPRRLPLDRNIHGPKVRANQWKFVDYDGDGTQDLIIGIGDWKEYGWDNAFDEKGEWTRGPLHGYVYLARNTGTNDQADIRGPGETHGRGQGDRRIWHAVAQHG